jgi:hypothetical protein
MRQPMCEPEDDCWLMPCTTVVTCIDGLAKVRSACVAKSVVDSPSCCKQSLLNNAA